MLGINIKIIVSNTHFIVVERFYLILYVYCLNKHRFKYTAKYTVVLEIYPNITNNLNILGD